MGKTYKISCAGFGGQGVMSMGQLLTYAGMEEGKEVAWVPSYGPEMRGGTANCSVIISDSPIGSPIVTEPDCLIAMNLPSLLKYEDIVSKGGKIFIDSALITEKSKREDVNAYYIPATKIAIDLGYPKLSNMVLLGKIIKEFEDFNLDTVKAVLETTIPPKKQDLLKANLEAITAGYNY